IYTRIFVGSVSCVYVTAIEQTESWTALQNSELYEVAAFWVRFTDADGVSVDLDFGEDLYGNTTVTTIATGSLYGKYDFESAVFVNGVYYQDAFLVIENAGTYGTGKYAYLWIGTESKDGAAVYVQGDEGSVFGYGSEYTFQNIDYQSFTFTVSENTVSCSDIGITIFSDNTGTLAIDSNGVAHFTPADGEQQEIEYFIEEGIMYVYTFQFKDGDRKFVLQSDGYGETEATEILPENIYEVGYLTEDRQNNYTARLIRLTDTTAILGLMVEDGDAYYYCYYGTWGENKDGDYGFIAMNSAFPENGYLDVYEEYGHFLFRTATVNGVNYFYQYDEAIEIECEAGKLVTDGYSIAEYTPANGEKITGTYFYDGNLVSIKTEAGDEYLLRIIDSEHFEISASTVGGEMGYYYSINDLGDGSEYYFFLDGKGTVMLHNGSSVRWGTYEKTGYVVMNVYEEYCLTFKGVDEEDQPTELKYHLILVPSGMISDDALYVQRDETQFGEYEIYENGAKVGELSGDGYFEGLYIVGEDLIAKGMLVRCEVEEDDYTQAIDYYPSTKGDFVLFLATDDDGNVTGEYLFELNKAGKAILRTLDYGTYGHYVNGEESGDYIYLDGHGVATVYNKSGEKTDEGKYREFPELGEGVYQYASDKGETTFVFTLSTVNGRNYYLHYTEKKVYTGTDWTALILDGFGKAVYVDRYGVRMVGDEINIALGVVALRPHSSIDMLYFEVNEDRTFRLISDGWVVRDGVLYLYTGGRANSLRIPDGVTTIFEGAFSSDTLDYLESIDLNGVTEIGANAFNGSGLSAISSENLQKIGEGAFKNCSSMRTVNIPSVTEIGAEAFYGCSSLTKVVLADIQKIGANAFTRSSYNSTVTEFDV
ncbi:MAG: leucine-rich repeat domain-containing protein, partial [Clostridia bacterium]|nr:leucine-rich repeat domain-containing protein [Clostridia bacterium]